MSLFKRLFMAIVFGLTIAAMAVPANAAMTQTITDRPNAYWYSGNYTRDYAWIWAQEVETIIEARTLELGYLTMTEGAIIANETDTQISFTEDNGSADENVIWDFGTNTIVITSGTGVVTWNWGAIVPTANQFLATPVSAAVGTVEGTIYYDSDTDILFVRDSSGWVDLTQQAGAATTLDSGYDSGGAGLGKKIEVDTGGIEFEVDDGSTSSTYALLLDYDDVTNNNPVLMIDNAGSGNSIDIQGTSGNDIEGTDDTWTISVTGVITTTGALTAASGDFTGAAGITLQNDETITNAVDTEIKFTDSGSSEDFSIDFLADQIAFKSGSGVVTVGWGDLDAHTGLNSLAFDAVASTISLAADGAGDDLTISVTGVQNSSLHLSSAGNAADALTIKTVTNGGGIDILADGAAGKDLDMGSTSGSVHISGGEAIADAVTITSAGGFDLTVVDDIDIQLTSGVAGEDISITQVGGNNSSIILTAAGTEESAATESDAAIQLIATGGGVGIRSAVSGGVADAIRLETDGGASDVLILHSNQGTGATSIHLLSDAGGITATASAGAIVLNATGGSAGDYTLTVGDEYILNVEGGIDVDSNEAAADAIALVAAAGGIDITSAGAGLDIDLLATGGRVTVTATETAASQFHVDAQGAHAGNAIILETTNSGILLLADGAADGDITLDAEGLVYITTAETAASQFHVNAQGAVADNAIILETTAAGIKLLADGAADGDITLDAEGIVYIVTAETAADQFKVNATGANAGDVIHLTSTDGGIMIDANGTTAGDIELNAVDDIILASLGNVTTTATAANGVGFFLVTSAFIHDGAVTAITGADATPDVSGKTFFTTGGADTYTGFDCGSGAPDVGQIVYVLSAHAAVFDTTASGAAYPFVGSSVDITTAAGDITVWIFDGTSFVLIQFTDISANNSTGT